MTTQQRDAERSLLARRLKELEKALEKVVDRTFGDVTEHLGDQIFDKFDSAVRAAATEAVPTASQWAGPRDQGGLHYM